MSEEQTGETKQALGCFFLIGVIVFCVSTCSIAKEWGKVEIEKIKSQERIQTIKGVTP